MHIVTLVVAAAGSLLLTPALIRFAEVRALYDVPTGGRRIHTTPVPRLGGLAIFASTLLALTAGVWLTDRVLTAAEQLFYLGMLVGGGGLALVGLVDDLQGLSARTKLLAQIAAGGVLYATGLRIDSFALGDAFHLELGIVALPITILWVVLVTNALNLIDGLDGLATGIASIALASLIAVAVALGNEVVLTMAVALLGALLGFLRFNFRPARIFLGDCGALFVGFVLAALSIAVADNASTAMLGLAPIFALALPLADTALSFTRRWLRGKSWSDADGRHIHHQLLARGIPHLRAVLMLYVVAGCVATLGLLAAFAPPTLVTVISLSGGLAAVALLVWGMGYLNYHEFPSAVKVMVEGPGRLRHVIREHIHAQDVARVIGMAGSVREINAILADCADDFGFVDMRIGREGDLRERRPIHPDADPRFRASVLEHPVAGAEPGDDPFVLRVWCRPESMRPLGRERLVATLGPAIGSRLASLTTPEPAPAPLRFDDPPTDDDELVATAEHQFQRYG